MSEIRKDILRRLYLVYFFSVLFALIIIGKILYIQLGEGETLRKRSNELTLRYFNIDASRGNILACDGSLLATSVPIFDVRLDLSDAVIPTDTFYKHLDSLSLCLSGLFKDKSALDYKKELRGEFRKENRYYILKRGISYAEVNKLKTFPLFKMGKYKGGFIIIPRYKRQMPFYPLAGRTIGYQRTFQGERMLDGVKQKFDTSIYVGLEGAYDEHLTGVSGKRLMQKIANNVWMPVNNDNEIEPKNGDDIVSTIDPKIQDVAQNALMKQLKINHAFQGCAVLMEVKTGYVRAIANLRLNPSDSSYYESYNYALAERLEPGSTFKLPSLLAALQDGKVDLNDLVFVGNGIKTFGKDTMRDSHAPPKSQLTVQEVFELSSNVGVSSIINKAYSANPWDYIEMLSKMKIDVPLNLELAGEGVPQIITPKSTHWSSVTSLPWMSIGYGIQITPLQILSIYNMVANNGTMLRPLFVQEIRQSGGIVQKMEPVILAQSVFSQATINKAKKMLEGVVEHGTAKNINKSVFKMAGKTGTARISEGKKGYGKYYNASFAGYFPADYPLYSCIVIINRPTCGEYYGSQISAPVFKEIADKVYASHLEILQTAQIDTTISKIPFIKNGNKKDISTILSKLNISYQGPESECDWVNVSVNDNTVKMTEKKLKKGEMANVIGMSLKDAVYILERQGYSVVISGKGLISKQELVPGKMEVKLILTQ